MQPDYRLVFDLAAQPFRPEPWMIIPLALTGVGALMVFKPALMQRLMPRGLQGRARTVYSWVWLIFATTITIAFVASTLGASSRLIAAREHGEAVGLEGCLQAFHPMPAAGHDQERLRIGGRTFSYSDFIVTPGFHRTEAYGGPIHADSRVKLSSEGDDIVRLEVADHACPVAPDMPRSPPEPD